MDFVVVGFGLGALVLLIGLAVRDLAPRLSRESSPDQPEQEASAPDQPRRFALAKDAPAVWGRACQSLGQVIMIGGGVIVAATMVGIIGQFSDDNGARLVIAAVLVAFAAIVLRAGQIGNSMYGADRRARSRAHAGAGTAAPPTVAERDKEEPAAEPTSPEAAAPESAIVVPNGHAPELQPTSNDAAPPLPDLQTLLGEHRGDNHRHRDEIVTLEQFLGLARDSTPAVDEDGASSPNNATVADEAVAVDEPAGGPDHSVDEDTLDRTSETNATPEDEPAADDDPASDSAQSDTAETAVNVAINEANQDNDVEKPREMVDQDASVDDSAVPHPVARTS